MTPNLLRSRSPSLGGASGTYRVEVSSAPSGAGWRTSSFGADSGGSCVEVAPTPTGVAVRDTKDRARAPHLHTAAAWRDFLAAVRNGEFDRP